MRSPKTDATLDLPDVNVLLAVIHPDHVHHAQAHDWLGQTQAFASTPLTESGLLRLALNPGIVPATLSAQREHIRLLG